MSELIRFESRKLFKTRAFYIIVSIALVMIVINCGIASIFSKEQGSSIMLSDIVAGAYGNGMITLLAAIFTALFVCEDEASGTLKNIYSRGFRRHDVYVAKFIVSLIATYIMFGLSLCVSVLVGKSISDGNGDNVLQLVLTQAILLLAYHTIYFVISIVIGKTGGSIAFCIVGPMFVSLGLNLIDTVMKLEDFKMSSIWLESLSGSLAVGCSNEVVVKCIILSIVYSAIAFIVGMNLNKKKEL